MIVIPSLLKNKIIFNEDKFMDYIKSDISSTIKNAYNLISIVN